MSVVKTSRFKWIEWYLFCTPSPLDMPAWYPLWLDPWQLSLKYSNSATKLPSDSVAQLIRAWQLESLTWVIVTLSSSFFLVFISFSLTVTWLKVWLSDLEHVPCDSRSPPPAHWTCQLGICFGRKWCWKSFFNLFWNYDAKSDANLSFCNIAFWYFCTLAQSRASFQNDYKNAHFPSWLGQSLVYS